MSCLYRALPAGCRSAPLESAFAQEAHARLAEAARVLGDIHFARAAARRAGRYELDEDNRYALGLAGAMLAEGGELPALSPERWVNLPAPIAPDGEVLGLLLTAAQEEAFTRFLARNHVSVLSPAQAVELARHYFFREPVTLVIR